MELAPDDPEIMFNFAAVLEATGQLTEALEYYKKSKEHGVDKAAVHIRNVRWTESAVQSHVRSNFSYRRSAQRYLASDYGTLRRRRRAPRKTARHELALRLFLPR